MSGGSLPITYTVHWSPASPWTGLNSKPTQSETSTTISGLRSNTRYTFTVSASNGDVSSQQSAERRFTTSKFQKRGVAKRQWAADHFKVFEFNTFLYMEHEFCIITKMTAKYIYFSLANKIIFGNINSSWTR